MLFFCGKEKLILERSNSCVHPFSIDISDCCKMITSPILFVIIDQSEGFSSEFLLATPSSASCAFLTTPFSRFAVDLKKLPPFSGVSSAEKRFTKYV